MQVEYVRGGGPKAAPLRTEILEASGLSLSYQFVECGVWALRCPHPYIRPIRPFGDVGGHHGQMVEVRALDFLVAS
jgi:hypothetical protein